MKTLIALLFVGGLSAQTPPMIPMATGGGPVGGATNLTTVGSVPYVSASGTLDQDAGQFFWDATNNRLGIGTATPNSLFTVGANNFTVGPFGQTTIAGYSTGSQLSIGGDPTALLGDVTIMRQGRDTNTGDNYIQSFGNNTANGRKLHLGGYSASFNPASAVVMTVDPANARVGIGTTAPAQALHVKSANNEILSDATTGDATISTAIAGVRKWSIYNQSAGNNLLFYDWTNSVSRVTVQPGTATAMTILASGNVGIGTPTPGYALQVVGQINIPDTNSYIWGAGTSYISGSSASNFITFNTAVTERMRITSAGNVGIGTTIPGVKLDVLGSARVYDSAADAAILIGSDQVDANSAKISYNRGTANLDITPRSTYATNLVGKLKFSITNSTGAGTALLGTNSPATILTAPYTWITVTTSDGTTGFMPIWK